jgi:hypothetical protein
MLVVDLKKYFINYDKDLWSDFRIHIIMNNNLGKEKLKQVIKYEYQLKIKYQIQCSKVDPCIRYTYYLQCNNSSSIHCSKELFSWQNGKIKSWN